jgi:hypothetical protein
MEHAAASESQESGNNGFVLIILWRSTPFEPGLINRS